MGMPCQVIQVSEGSLYTRKQIITMPEKDGFIASDAQQDVAFSGIESVSSL